MVKNIKSEVAITHIIIIYMYIFTTETNITRKHSESENLRQDVVLNSIKSQFHTMTDKITSDSHYIYICNNHI